MQCQELAHAADLAVQALNQRNAEHETGHLFDLATFGDRTQYRYPGTHTLHEFCGHRLVDGDQVDLVAVGGQQVFNDVLEMPSLGLTVASVAGQEHHHLGQLRDAQLRPVLSPDG